MDISFLKIKCFSCFVKENKKKTAASKCTHVHVQTEQKVVGPVCIEKLFKQDRILGAF